MPSIRRECYSCVLLLPAQGEASCRSRQSSMVNGQGQGSSLGVGASFPVSQCRVRNSSAREVVTRTGLRARAPPRAALPGLPPLSYRRLASRPNFYNTLTPVTAWPSGAAFLGSTRSKHSRPALAAGAAPPYPWGGPRAPYSRFHPSVKSIVLIALCGSVNLGFTLRRDIAMGQQGIAPREVALPPLCQLPLVGSTALGCT